MNERVADESNTTRKSLLATFERETTANGGASHGAAAAAAAAAADDAFAFEGDHASATDVPHLDFFYPRLFIAFVCSIMVTSPLGGWAAMSTLLVEQAEVFGGDEEKVATLYFVSMFFSTALFALIGTLFDVVGPRVTAALGGGLVCIGFALSAVAVKHAHWLLFISFPLADLGDQMASITIFGFVPYGPRMSTVIFSLSTSSYMLAALMTFAAVEVSHRSRSVAEGFFVIGVVVAAATAIMCIVLPSQPEVRPPPPPPAALVSDAEADEVSLVRPGGGGAHKKKKKQRSGGSATSAAAAARGRQSSSEESSELRTAAEEFSDEEDAFRQMVTNAREVIRIMFYQTRSACILNSLAVACLVFINLTCVIWIGGFEPITEYLFGEEQSAEATNEALLAMFVIGTFVSPVAGALNDRFGLRLTVCVVVVVYALMATLTMSTTYDAQIAVAWLSPIAIALNLNFAPIWANLVLPTELVASGYGLAYAAVGVFNNLVGIGVSSFADARGNPFEDYGRAIGFTAFGTCVLFAALGLLARRTKPVQQ